MGRAPSSQGLVPPPTATRLALRELWLAGLAAVELPPAASADSGGGENRIASPVSVSCQLRTWNPRIPIPHLDGCPQRVEALVPPPRELPLLRFLFFQVHIHSVNRHQQASWKGLDCIAQCLNFGDGSSPWCHLPPSHGHALYVTISGSFLGIHVRFGLRVGGHPP